MTNDEKAAQLFKCLAHPTRLAIVMKLSGGKKCVRKFVKELGLKQANVSQHLSILRQCGLVTSKREEDKVCYYLNYKELAEIVRTARKVTKRK